MRIKEINLQRYGPLPKFHKEFGDGIHLIYGTNESGKTLLVDATMKMLIGGKKFHDSLRRVEETPEGYVVLYHDGDDIKISDKENLEKIMEIDSDDLRNIFCIRDADLRITEEAQFYERTQDKLAGLRSSDIRRIIDSLLQRGRLSSPGSLSDAEKYDKAKSVYNKAKSLIKEIKKYIDEAKEKQIEKLELELFDTKSYQASLNTHLEQLEKAKKKQEFEKIKTEFNLLKDLIDEIGAVPEDNIQRLQDLIKDYEKVDGKQSEYLRNLENYKNMTYVTFGFSVITFIAAFLLPLQVIGLFLPVGFILVGIYSIYLWRKNNLGLSEIERQEKQIKALSQEIGIDSDTIHLVKSEFKALVKHIEETRKTLYEKIGIVKDYFEMKTENTVELLESASQKLSEVEKEVDQSVTVEYTESEFVAIDEKIRDAQKKIDEINERLKTHRDKLAEYAARITELNYSRFMDEELDISIDNIESLSLILSPLEALEYKIELDKETVETAIKIFKSLETEEEEKITELFSKDSSAAEIFKDITQGRYSDLRYDTEKKKIMVERPNGEILDVSKLSKGTYDQLYLAIRVALGQKILEGSPGFFIMDDAFLSSDETRLKTQVQLLEHLSQNGWQIIYITTKKEVVDKITKITTNELITLKTLS